VPWITPSVSALQTAESGRSSTPAGSQILCAKSMVSIKEDGRKELEDLFQGGCPQMRLRYGREYILGWGVHTSLIIF
jgi:hypothetical protein